MSADPRSSWHAIAIPKFFFKSSLILLLPEPGSPIIIIITGAGADFLLSFDLPFVFFIENPKCFWKNIFFGRILPKKKKKLYVNRFSQKISYSFKYIKWFFINGSGNQIGCVWIRFFLCFFLFSISFLMLFLSKVVLESQR